MASKGSKGAKTSKTTSQSTSKTSSTSAGAPSKPSAKFTEPSDYSIYKEWGSHEKFMLSYGLNIRDADDCEEGKAIIQAFKDYDRQVASDARGNR